MLEPRLYPKLGVPADVRHLVDPVDVVPTYPQTDARRYGAPVQNPVRSLLADTRQASGPPCGVTTSDVLHPDAPVVGRASATGRRLVSGTNRFSKTTIAPVVPGGVS